MIPDTYSTLSMQLAAKRLRAQAVVSTLLGVAGVVGEVSGLVLDSPLLAMSGAGVFVAAIAWRCGIELAICRARV